MIFKKFPFDLGLVDSSNKTRQNPSNSVIPIRFNFVKTSVVLVRKSHSLWPFPRLVPPPAR